MTGKLLNAAPLASTSDVVAHWQAQGTSPKQKIRAAYRCRHAGELSVSGKKKGLARLIRAEAHSQHGDIHGSGRKRMKGKWGRKKGVAPQRTYPSRRHPISRRLPYAPPATPVMVWQRPTPAARLRERITQRALFLRKDRARIDVWECRGANVLEKAEVVVG